MQVGSKSTLIAQQDKNFNPFFERINQALSVLNEKDLQQDLQIEPMQINDTQTESIEEVRYHADSEDDTAMEIDSPLSPFIQYQVLKNIYQYFLANKAQIRNELIEHHAFRLPKELSGLTRTVNIVSDAKGDWVLLLETKRKLASNLKNENQPIYKGSFKKGKDTWRIDSATPEKWVNLVVASAGPEIVDDAVAEAHYSQVLAQQPLAKKDTRSLFNESFIGQCFYKKGQYKQSLYAPKAIPLSDMLNNPYIKLTQRDKDEIANGILHALEVIHSRGEVFQDIKPANVLIYQDGQGYYAKLNDFGQSTAFINNNRAMSTLQYESPEISFAYRFVKNHTYYINKEYASFGRAVSSVFYPRPTMNEQQNLNLAAEYYNPHSKNDMWAAGVLFYELYMGKQLKENVNDSEQQKNIMNHPLLQGLLEVDREKRFTAIQALAQFGRLEQSKVDLAQRTDNQARLEDHVVTIDNLDNLMDLSWDMAQKFPVDGDIDLERGQLFVPDRKRKLEAKLDEFCIEMPIENMDMGVDLFEPTHPQDWVIYSREQKR